MQDTFGARSTLRLADGEVEIYRLDALEKAGFGSVSTLPFSIKVLLEAILRNIDDFAITNDHARLLAEWGSSDEDSEIPFMPARVILQDFTGVPSVVDLAALRSALERLGGDPERINPASRADLVIDHSVQVDAFGSLAALFINAEREFERNRERYEFLHWGQRAFENFRVVPPASGIVHQVNLEYLGSVVETAVRDGVRLAFPDSLVGTDSHTTMINGLGILGWGVGGIEAEAVMLGQPIYMLSPKVLGFRLTGALPDGATATDLVLRVTELLRQHGVVGKFVEFYGDGLGRLSLPDRATIANMAPEYGATIGFFPVDNETLRYLKGTGRPAELIDLVERYSKEQGLWRHEDTPDPEFSETIDLDMSTVEPSVAGPKRPQDRVPLARTKSAFFNSLESIFGVPTKTSAEDRQRLEDDLGGRCADRLNLFASDCVPVLIDGEESILTHGSVVIAAITSCTNTSNPSVMVGAGLLAKKAVELGLDRRPHVKTSMAPGSRVVTRYLDAAGLTPYLQALGFHTVGYGCTTCIGNSGPLPQPIAEAVADNDLVVTSVLSGNRNFEGRINPLVKANYLASPPLVVAYALAGTMDIDFAREPIGRDPNGRPVYLEELWPSQKEIRDTVASCLDPEMFRSEYARIFEGNEAWNAIPARGGVLYEWDAASTYIQEPPFFQGITRELPRAEPVRSARALALLGHSITTDHISPAGAIPLDSPAGRYLLDHGVEHRDFNSFGSRRGNHEVMMRGTFGNIRLRNHLAPDTEGGWTTYLPTGEVMSIYDAAMRYKAEGTPLIVLAGREYGTGSSRDWAAKGTILLGVRAVIAESYERIHRSNLIGMGVLPLQFVAGEGWEGLGLSGHESFDLEIPETLAPRQRIPVTATRTDGESLKFETEARIDSPIEVRYYRNGGILHTVLRDMLETAESVTVGEPS